MHLMTHQLCSHDFLFLINRTLPDLYLLFLRRQHILTVLLIQFIADLLTHLFLTADDGGQGVQTRVLDYGGKHIMQRALTPATFEPATEPQCVMTSLANYAKWQIMLNIVPSLL